jgi:flavin-dependent dehydrogenase
MDENKSDVIIVGARCAGAALAALLARQGVRTLVLESAQLGAGMPMSTHYLQPPGMDVLDAIGVGDRVRRVTPASRVARIAVDDCEVLSHAPQGRFGYCVRRSTLDPWLQDAAAEAGADVRGRHRVVELVHSSGRVVGVVAETPSGRETFRAGLVVGADGPRSTIAALTKVEEYLVSEGTRGGYWAYYPAPAQWSAPWDMTFEHRGDALRYVFRCDGDRVLLTGAPPVAEAATWGAEHRRRLHEFMLASNVTRPLVEGQQPVEKGAGLLRTRFFYRRPVGPGFALVGDAGHFKDFVTGQGMTDALLDAVRLSRAIVDGRDVAFERFWRTRDVETMPLHFDALRQGRVGFNSPFIRWVFERVQQRPELSARIWSVFDRRLAPHAIAPLPSLAAWGAEALLRGRLDVLKGFATTLSELLAEEKEQRARERLLHGPRCDDRESVGAPVDAVGCGREVSYEPAPRRDVRIPDLALGLRAEHGLWHGWR